jgi:GTP-binding protein
MGVQLHHHSNFHSRGRAIEYIVADELVEATPRFLRMRKRELDEKKRRNAAKG